jgi:hypothetical protein
MCDKNTGAVLVTLVIRAFAIRNFISVLKGAAISYPWTNFKAYYLRRTFPILVRECNADDRLRILAPV